MSEDLVVLVTRPLGIRRAAARVNGKTNALCNVGGVVLEEDGVCGGHFHGLEVRFAEHLLVAETVDLDTLDLGAGGLLGGSWRRCVTIRQEVVGNVAEVPHVEVLARDLIRAQSLLAVGYDRAPPIVVLSGFGGNDAGNAVVCLRSVDEKGVTMTDVDCV